MIGLNQKVSSIKTNLRDFTTWLYILAYALILIPIGTVIWFHISYALSYVLEAPSKLVMVGVDIMLLIGSVMLIILNTGKR